MKTKHFIVIALIFVLGFISYAIYAYITTNGYEQSRAIKCIEKGLTQSEYAIIAVNEGIVISYDEAKNLYAEQKASEKADSIYFSLKNKLED